jgi:hypothetical protein
MIFQGMEERHRKGLANERQNALCRAGGKS